MDGEALEPGDDPEEVPAIMTHKIIRMPIGQTVVLSVLRTKGQPLQDITVTLEERTRPANKAARFFAEDLGFTTRELVFADTYSHKLPADTKGVLVAYIKQSSSAATGKLRPDDLITMLNQTPVENLEQFKSQYQAFRKDHSRDAVVVEVQRRDGTTEVIRIEPPR